MLDDRHPVVGTIGRPPGFRHGWIIEVVALGRKLTRSEAARALPVLSGAALGLGGLMLVLPGAAGALLGFPRGGGPRRLLRLAGVRDLLLGLGLLVAARGYDRGLKRSTARLMAAAQAGDVAATTAMFARGAVGPRALLTVTAGAIPAMLVALAVADNYRTE